MNSSKPIVGALVFESARYGHIMVSADVADNGDPCLKFIVAAHPHFLHPTTTKLRFRQGFNQYEALENLTGEQVEAIARNIHEQAAQFIPAVAPPPREREPWLCLLCKSGQPGFHGTLDDRVTPCPNGKSAPAREPLNTEVARRMVWSASSWLRSEGVNEDDVLEVIAAVERIHGIGKNKG